MTGSADAGNCADVDCGEVLVELQRFVDGEIGPERVESMREHLAACYPCADRAEFERQFRALVRARCGGETAPPNLLDRIRACLDDAERAEDQG